VLLTLGFWVGRYTVIKPFQQEMDAHSKAFFLNDLFVDKPEPDLAGVYYDGKEILDKLGEIPWAVPNIPTPFVGSAPLPGKHGVAQVNSMQFRAEKELTIPKPNDTYRIFLTGGSTAFGSGAPSDAGTIGGYLESILTRELSPKTKLTYEVFTMASPAWSSTHERIVIENYLSQLAPDMIISFSGNNDVHWGNMGRNVLWFRSYYDEFFLRLIKKVYRNTGQPEIPENTKIEQGEKIPPNIVATRLLNNVRLSSFALRLAEADYVFVLQPTMAVTEKKLTSRERKSLSNQKYFQTCYGLMGKYLPTISMDNYSFINLSHIFDKYGAQDEIFIDSYHFGDKGNELIANNIVMQIKERMTK